MSISNSPSSEVWQEIARSRLQDDGSAARLPERIEIRLAGLIEDGALAPGTRLPSERELSRIFQVSRLAVREAAHRLEARGLVAVRRGAGSFVASSPPVAAKTDPAPPRTTVDVDELADVRMLLEPAAADWAARRVDRSALAVLHRIAAQFEEAIREEVPRYDLLAASDVDFHLEVARAADNAVLVQLIAQLHRFHRLQLEWDLRRPGRLAETATEHRRVVEAIVAGDPAAARDAMIEHLSAAAASFRLARPGAGSD
jgi:GntR family transcriptional repressor for pyruvate dehydrogenase complex